MKYEELQLKLLQFLEPYWDRVIAFDFETHVEKDEFLSNERILSISIARRISNKFMESEGIELKTMILKNDDDESEMELLKEFNDELGKIKPIGVIGYCSKFYDLPLLMLKRSNYYRKHKLSIWKVVDFLEASLHLDLYQFFKFKEKKRFHDVLTYTEFSELPFMKTKNIVSSSRDKKGKDIIRLWKEDKENLKKYNEGDVHDTLLLAEFILTNLEYFKQKFF